jgi:large subunit ribosomal protein L24
MARHIKKDDIVEVICGDHKGERGKVLRVIPRRDMAVVEGVNMVFRHVRPSRRNPQGGRLQKEAPIHVSNLLPVDPKTGRGSRVRFEIKTDERGRVVSKKRCTVKGSVLDEIIVASRS